MKFLPVCLKSIFNQTYKNFQVLIIDNNSKDGTVDFLRRNYPEVAVFQNKKNLGFAKANNQGISLLHSPYILFCNPDIVLADTWLEVVMEKAELEKYSGAGSFGGKLLKMRLIEGGIENESKTDIIDSCGLRVLGNRKVVELGADEKSGKFENEQEVFGHSGALVLYRRKTLDDLAISISSGNLKEYFDEDFFAYKEDIDLAWRSRLFGWRSFLFPAACAYHARSLFGSKSGKVSDVIKNRRRQPALSRYYSYRNHLLLLLKNESAAYFWRDFWRIIWQEKVKAIYILFFEFSSAKAWFEILKLMPKMLKKRKIIFQRVKINSSQIRRWYGNISNNK